MLVYFLLLGTYLMYLETVQSCAAVLLIDTNGKQTVFDALNYYSYNTIQDKIFYWQELLLILTHDSLVLLFYTPWIPLFWKFIPTVDNNCHGKKNKTTAI